LLPGKETPGLARRGVDGREGRDVGGGGGALAGRRRWEIEPCDAAHGEGDDGGKTERYPGAKGEAPVFGSLAARAELRDERGVVASVQRLP
jgi:hypothetical protein